MICPTILPRSSGSRLASLLLLILGCLSIAVNSQLLGANDKRNDFGREFLPFGKRMPSDADFQREFMSFGKRAPVEPFQRDFMAFGKRVPEGFQRDFMTFGKRSSAGFDREFMAFGRRK